MSKSFFLWTITITSLLIFLYFFFSVRLRWFVGKSWIKNLACSTIPVDSHVIKELILLDAWLSICFKGDGRLHCSAVEIELIAVMSSFRKPDILHSNPQSEERKGTRELIISGMGYLYSEIYCKAEVKWVLSIPDRVPVDYRIVQRPLYTVKLELWQKIERGMEEFLFIDQ